MTYSRINMRNRLLSDSTKRREYFILSSARTYIYRSIHILQPSVLPPTYTPHQYSPIYTHTERKWSFEVIKYHGSDESWSPYLWWGTQTQPRTPSCTLWCANSDRVISSWRTSDNKCQRYLIKILQKNRIYFGIWQPSS